MADLSSKTIENQREEVDYFDLLPDPILHLIFNKLFDAKTLCSCLLVSKRCASLVCEIDSISIRLNDSKMSTGNTNKSDNNNNNNHHLTKSKKPIEDSTRISSGSSSSSKSFLKNPIFKFICKPVYLLQQAIANKKMSNSSSKIASGVDILKWVGNTLNNFQEIQLLELELPCNGGEIGVNKNIPLLKWEAEFGKEMEKCAILGATSVCDKREKKLGLENEEANTNNNENNNNNNNNNENEMQVFSDEELKMRIIWIISCLIASSARHNLMKRIVGQCQKLSNAVISDAGKQGKLSMNSNQIKELRNSLKPSSMNSTGNVENPSTDSQSEAGNEAIGDETASATATTTTTTAAATSMGYAGNLVMKMWYVKELELPKCGKVLKGATLVVIKPEKKNNVISEKKEIEGDLLSMCKAFEGDQVFEEAAKELLKRKEKRMYRLEMNSF